MGLGITLPLDLGDYFNSGSDLSSVSGIEDGGFAYAVPALNLQFGRFGIGATLEAETVSLVGRETTLSEGGLRVSVQFLTLHVQAAAMFLDGQLVIGLGGALLAERVLGARNFLDVDPLYSAAAVGAEVGLLYRPNGKQYRIGAALFSPLETNPTADGATGDVMARGFYVPRSAFVPWQLQAGAALQIGRRPLNPRWQSVKEVVAGELGARREAMEDEALDRYEKAVWRRLRHGYRTLDPLFVLLTASIVIDGPTRDAVSVEAFLRQRVQRSGSTAVLSPHFGLETEPWTGVLRTRVGFYVEPPRIEGSLARFHWTGGIDLKLGGWDVFGIWPEDYVWKITSALDAAPDYLVWSIGIGGWY